MSWTFQFLLVLLLLAGIVRADDAYNNVTDGPHSCGGVDIPYPFGITDEYGNGDFRDGFQVTCDAGNPGLATTGGDGKPIPIGNFSIKTAEARVWLPVTWQCYDSSGNAKANDSAFPELHFYDESVYRISNSRNYFFVLGCATLGLLRSKLRPVAGESNSTFYTQLAGCACYCDDSKSAVSGSCSGVGCCRADIPPDLVDNSVHFDASAIRLGVNVTSFSPCDYAFLAEKDNYTFHTADLNMDLHLTPLLMPVTLDWAIRDNLTCKEAKNKETYACKSSNSLCLNATNGPGYICKCRKGYEGNPYILDGCTDINECEHLDHYPCGGVCKNKQGSYECTCDKHSHSVDPFKEPCRPYLTLKARIAIGAAASVVLSLFIIVIIVSFWKIHNEKIKLRKHFQKNGGPTLEKVNNIKLFTTQDIKKIRKTGKFIGNGAFGKVYSGHIEDSNQPVAVKEPIKGNSADKDQFANEIIIQSQLIHRNIVKLVGCCLEVDVPILVYEYVSQGSLDNILHGSRKIPLNMDCRLRIAAEVAEGLAYMHSKTNTPIIHGDVKPANILLSDDFVPKISDFGISKLIAADKQHTGNVIGDMKYMDPVFLQTGLLTNKSDVYSFGVVLLELITRKKASRSDKNSLLKNFLEAYTKDKCVIELVDKELGEVDLDLLGSLSGMINECLNLDDSQRPEMTDVAEGLRQMVKRYHSK